MADSFLLNIVFLNVKKLKRSIRVKSNTVNPENPNPESTLTILILSNPQTLPHSYPLTHQSHPFTAPPLKISLAFFSTSGD